jgi:hypothetical protein
MAQIHERLLDVMNDVQSVAKSDRNSSQNFNFRGIDAVINAVGPAFRKHGVFVLPSIVTSEYTQVEIGKNRTPMGHARIEVQYTFVASDGSFTDCTVPAEAMDSGDKATAKAMSVALRTALLQVLALPTDEPDPDASTYERASVASVSDEEFNKVAEFLGAVANAEELDAVSLSLRDMPLNDYQRSVLVGLYKLAKARIGE